MRTLLFMALLSLASSALAAVDPEKGVFGGFWVRESRAPSTTEINNVWKELAAPVFADAYNGTSSTPGVWVGAWMPKTVVKGPDQYDFSALQPILNSIPIKEHGGHVGLEMRMEGKVFPAHWQKYLITPAGKKRQIMDLGNPAAMVEYRKYLSRFATEANKHPQIKFLCLGEMSGSGSFSAEKAETVKLLADELKHAYACVKQNNDIWDDIKDYPGVLKAVAGPKLAEGGCGSSGENWPMFDCKKSGRYASFQWGNVFGAKPPSPYPLTISVAAIEPNEFRMTGDGIGNHNPWGKPLPSKDLSGGKFNINNKVVLWWLSGAPRFPENAKKYGIKAVGGIQPATIIALGTSAGINWPGRTQDIHDAVRMFGFRGTGQLFPDFADAEPIIRQCNDGVDNDNDNLIDMADPDCSGPYDDDETDPQPPSRVQCENGADDDSDGLIDMLDPGCTSPNDDDERNEVEPPPCDATDAIRDLNQAKDLIDSAMHKLK